MKPKKPPNTDPQKDLFRVELEDIIDHRHPMVTLSTQIPWEDFDAAFSPRYCADNGRPAIATRLMVGLHYLKHTFDLSDAEVVVRWVENPYWQYFCGMKYFEHEPPIDPSSMSRWRSKQGEAGAEELLAATVKAGLRSGVVKPSSFLRINVDTTVQEKAAAHPTDARLYQRMRERLASLARRQGVELRQSYARKGKNALMMAGRYAHARRMSQSRREIRNLRTYLGRVKRDVERKIMGNAYLERVFAEALAMAQRLLDQKRDGKNKLYSIHAPEVECISKGKAHKKYEFGVKVGVVTTSRDNFVIGMKALAGNPYDGHTLSACVAQAERMTGKEITGDVFVDRGYRKHDYKGSANVNIGKSRRGLCPTMRKWMKRRAAIEPIIGHMKNDGKLGRNWLKGTEGDSINALLCGCGQNLRKLLRKAFLLRIFTCLLIAYSQIAQRRSRAPVFQLNSIALVII
jgi:transposase, IS5 family